MDKQSIINLFSTIDTRNPAGICTYLSEDVAFTFGNSPVINGHEAVIAALEEFFEYVIDIEHEIIGTWHTDNTWIVETRVRYQDKFERTFKFPACNIMVHDNDKICDYRIFVDNSAMFVPPIDN